MATEPTTTDESTRDFYPENAQDINFQQAQEAAVVNAQADADRAAEDKKAADANATTPENIPAHPELTESTNPEQVLVEEETVPKASAPAPVVEATPEV